MSSTATATLSCRLGAGVWLWRQRAWDTNGLLSLEAGRALVCGPGVTLPDAGERVVDVLLTHVDFDHLRSAVAHPGAVVHASRLTADALDDPELMGRYASMAGDWGTPWEAPPRAHSTFNPGDKLELGSGPVSTFAAPGHTPDSVGYLLERDEILLPGDYLSVTTFPLVTASFDEAIETHRRLLDLLDRTDVRLVVPGHGPALDPLGAGAVAREDLAYLDAVRQSAEDAVREGLSEEECLMRVYRAVATPRQARGGFEALDMHATNIRRACAGASHEAPR